MDPVTRVPAPVRRARADGSPDASGTAVPAAAASYPATVADSVASGGTTSLIDTRTDSPLWSDTFDRSLDAATLFEIQSEIAYNVAAALRAELTTRERERVAHIPTSNLEAYRHYLLGRYHWNRRDEAGMDSALAHYEAALRLDPLYAAAYAGIADVHVLGYGPAGTSGPPLALAAARRAVELDPELAPAYASLGMALALHNRDWRAAERAFQRGIRLDPSYATAHQWYGELLVTQGRLEQAVTEARTAEALDPLSLIISWNVARILIFAQRHDEALEKLRTLQRQHPADARVNTLLAAHLLNSRQHVEAAAVLDGMADAVQRSYTDSTGAARLRRVADAMRSGRIDPFVQLLIDDAGGESHAVMFRASHLARTGRKSEALSMLERAYARHGLGLMAPDLTAGETFHALRDEPRFTSLLRTMNIDPDLGRRLRDQHLRSGRVFLQP